MVKNVRKKTDWSSKILMIIFFLGPASILIFAGLESLYMVNEMQSWQPRKGKIVSSRLESGNGVHLDIIIKVKGQMNPKPARVTYGTFISQKDYRSWAKKYTQGKLVEVYVNPDNPNDIVIKRHDSYRSGFLFLLGGFILLYIGFNVTFKP